MNSSKTHKSSLGLKSFVFVLIFVFTICALEPLLLADGTGGQPNPEPCTDCMDDSTTYLEAQPEDTNSTGLLNDLIKLISSVF